MSVIVQTKDIKVDVGVLGTTLIDMSVVLDMDEQSQSFGRGTCPAYKGPNRSWRYVLNIIKGVQCIFHLQSMQFL